MENSLDKEKLESTGAAAAPSGRVETVEELPRRTRSFLMRGESVIATGGIVLASILLLAMAASGWWTLQAQREAIATARREQVLAVESLLRESAEVMLAQNEVSAVRRLVSDAGRQYKLSKCQILLPDRGVVASSEPGKVSVHKLPLTWADGPTDPPSTVSNDSLLVLSNPLSVPGRGTARLELAAPIDYPMGTFLETQAGVGAIGAAALVSLLLVYRNMRHRLRAMGAIREALLALGGGEASMAALSVGPDLGPEAVAWNDLLLRNEKLSKTLVVNQAREAITDRRVNRGELDAAFDAMSQGLVLVGEKMEVKFINGAAAAFLQNKRDEMLGNDVSKFIVHEAVTKAIEGVARGGVRRRTTIEVTRAGEDGNGVLKFSVRPVRREDSAAAMVIIEDVTQQRVADEARNAFVAQATHELRTPLTNIRLYVETAIDEGANDPSVRAKCLNVINQEARRLENIVGEMLSVSEIEAGSFKLNRGDLRLDSLFAELAADYEGQAKDRGLEFKVNLPPKLPAIKADREKITLALHNLMGNALKYTPAGGHVTMNVAVHKSALTVEVIDTGYGIAEDDQKRIFDKFYRATQDPRVGKVTGTGLGLTLAREVVRLHGGDIVVDSQLNKGSTFTMTIPITAEAV